MAGQEGREEEKLGSKSVRAVESETGPCELESRRAGSRPMHREEVEDLDLLRVLPLGLASESPFRNQEVDRGRVWSLGAGVAWGEPLRR